jgi:hypothetical protein
VSASNYVHLEFAKILQAIPKALLVLFEDGTQHWIPASQVADSDDYDYGDGPGDISVTEWFANKEGLGR